MRFFEIVYNWSHDVLDWFRSRNDTDIFIGTVVFLMLLRMVGYAGLSVFVALIYIMWFVSAGRR